MTPRVNLMRELLLRDANWRDPNPSRSEVTALQHALQVATRARWRTHDAQLIVAGLLHDAARPFSDLRHGQVIAEMLWDRVRPEIYYALWHHGEYQQAVLAGGPMPGGPREAEFLASWDMMSFDPTFQPDTLESFGPELGLVLDGV